MSDDELFNVLFLCTGNSARSVMGECILNRLGRGRFRAFSAGSHPKGEINPHTIETLKKLNYVSDDLRSKSWDEFAVPGAPELQFVFTVCDQAGAGSLSALARPTHVRPLGHSRPGRGGR